MKKSVIITKHPETGAMLTPAKEGWSTMAVKQTSYSLEGVNGITSRTAFITKENSVWDILKSELNLNIGANLIGQIVRIESRNPQYPNHQPKKYPENAKVKAGEVFLVDNAPVYFQDKYTEDVSAKDELITLSTKNNVVVAELIAD